jgi:hypothetical protein
MAELSPNRKRVAILVVVVGSALIGHRVVTLSDADEGVVVPAAPQSTRPAETGARAVAGGADPSDLRLRLDRLDAREQALAALEPRARAPQAKAGLFDSVSWRPPAPPAPPPPPPPKPTAPPFPYTYVGGLLDNNVRTAFFEKGERVVALKAGDTVEGVYRVDQMTDQNMQLTYLPLEQRMTVPLGRAR